LLGLVRRRLGFDQTETIAVVDGDRLRSRAEKRGEWHACGDCQRVPASNVDPGEHHGDDSAHSDQSKVPPQRRANLKRCYRRIGDDLGRCVEDARHCGRDRGKIAEHIGATSNALRGFEVDQQQRRMANRLRARAEGPCHRH